MTDVRDTVLLRRSNTALVLRSLRQDGPASRSELALRTGLAKATVGAIVAELSERGALSEEPAAAEPGRQGRPGRPVRLLGTAAVALGLEVNVDYVTVVELDLTGQTRRVETRAVPGSQAPLDAVVDLAAEAAAGLRASGVPLVGATVAVPGLVGGDGRVAWAPNLGWEGLDVAAALAEAVGHDLIATVENDANCAARAEASHGVSADTTSSLYLTGTIGIGAGMIDDGRLLRGGTGFAGEVGHMPFGDPSARCGCGRFGCWEATIGLRAMLAAVGMTEVEDPLRTAELVAVRAATEPEVAAALAALGRDLGSGLATLAAMLDPSVVVLGGYFVPLGAHLVPSAAEVLASRLPSGSLHLPEIRLSTLELHAAALGAAETALGAVFEGRLGL